MVLVGVLDDPEAIVNIEQRIWTFALCIQTAILNSITSLII